MLLQPLQQPISPPKKKGSIDALFFITDKQKLVDLQKMPYDAVEKITEAKLSEDFKKVAADRGLVITDNEGSGNCMFYALSHQLHHVKGISISHEELRQRLVGYLRDNPRMVRNKYWIVFCSIGLKLVKKVCSFH